MLERNNVALCRLLGFLCHSLAGFLLTPHPQRHLISRLDFSHPVITSKHGIIDVLQVKHGIPRDPARAPLLQRPGFFLKGRNQCILGIAFEGRVDDLPQGQPFVYHQLIKVIDQ